MNAASLDAMTPLQRTIVERALAKELEATAGSAPHGQVIDRCESLLLGKGREFLRRALEDTSSPGSRPSKKARVAEPALLDATLCTLVARFENLRGGNV